MTQTNSKATTQTNQAQQNLVETMFALANAMDHLAKMQQKRNKKA